MATIDYDGKKVALIPGQLILDSGMNVFGLHLFMESVDHVPDGIPTAFAFEHRGVRVVIDRAPNCEPSDESLSISIPITCATCGEPYTPLHVCKKRTG